MNSMRQVGPCLVGVFALFFLVSGLRAVPPQTGNAVCDTRVVDAGSMFDLDCKFWCSIGDEDETQAKCSPIVLVRTYGELNLCRCPGSNPDTCCQSAFVRNWQAGIDYVVCYGGCGLPQCDSEASNCVQEDSWDGWRCYCSSI